MYCIPTPLQFSELETTSYEQRHRLKYKFRKTIVQEGKRLAIVFLEKKVGRAQHPEYYPMEACDSLLFGLNSLQAVVGMSHSCQDFLKLI